MKSVLRIMSLLGCLVLGAGVQAQMFQTVAPEKAQLRQTGPAKLYCPQCGMNLVKFYKTSHLLLDDGEVVAQYCSLHCLVAAHPEADEVMVVDAEHLDFIPVSAAHYVVGSDVKGTMTMTSKYAFADLAEAREFARKHGGVIMDFGEAVARAQKDLATENKMIAKKQARMAQKGRKIHDALCAGADLPPFSSVAQAKAFLVDHHPCGELDDGQYQAVALYLMSRGGADTPLEPPILVPENAKCPVCGMFVDKYPHWAAELVAADGHKYYFDGVKDMMKFVFGPQKYHVKLAAKDIISLRVSDYYNLNPLDARQAWFVTGSNVFGPMGDELVPFRTRKEAEVFQKDHFGETIVDFGGITPELVRGLDQ